jgi:hypothetical protein
LARLDDERFDEPETLLLVSTQLLSGKLAGVGHAWIGFSGEDKQARVKNAVDAAQMLIAEVRGRYPAAPATTDTHGNDWRAPPPAPPDPPPSPTLEPTGAIGKLPGEAIGGGEPTETKAGAELSQSGAAAAGLATGGATDGVQQSA